MAKDWANLIYQAIIDYKADHDGNSPTYLQLMKMTGVSSTSLVYNHLWVLQDRGLIRLLGGGRRSGVIEVIGGRWVAPSRSEDGTAARQEGPCD